MALVTTASIVATARAAGAGVAAFNVVQLENVESLLAAAARTGRPVVISISHNAVRYHGELAPLARACLAAADTSEGVASVHLDHAETPALVREAVALGLSSVMFDASSLDYADNVARTAQVVQECHASGVWVEAELGAIGGKGGVHVPGVRTDPGEAVSYLTATGVDALAVAVGTSHKMVERTAALDFGLIAALRSALRVPLVLHGSSGVSDENLRRAIAAGMTKVNIATQLNKKFTAAVREHLAANPDDVDPRRYLGAGREAMTDEAAHLLEVITTPAAQPGPNG